MEDFTTGITHDQPTRRQSSLGAPFDERIHELVKDWGAEKSPELIEEMIGTALNMARDKMGTGDLKLMNRSLKELRYAAKMFSGYR
ncbi:MAG TPA: cytochrome D ubiquinol oxidase subunit II, partial [Chthoniobacterales bacterium]|nr:cytochrome D ubiquinol oxidase subunit II [Chthoniobacterales bacterium]